MKLKSLILGSVAAAGLATGAQAADLGVLTSLDVCDALGLSGLTISSDTNCLQITGAVSYKFVWGDYNGVNQVVNPPAGAFNIIDNDETAVNVNNDWESYGEAWLKFVATADSDFGAAKAVIKLRQRWQTLGKNEVTSTGGDEHVLRAQEAYVSIGDTTVIMAGKKGSIINDGDDEPFNWLGLFNSEKVDAGISIGGAVTGGHVIQVVSDLGNGVNVGVGLENLSGDNAAGLAGTAIGVISYAGEGITAHVNLLAGGILDSEVDNYAVHAGFTGSFEQFRIRGAFMANNAPVTTFNAVADSNWQALASAEATFDMFKLAVSGEAQSTNTNGATVNSAGFGASASAAVTDGITINLGGRWFDNNTATANNEGYQVAASLVAAVTETIKVTGEVGVYGNNYVVPGALSVYYGSAEVAWAPGGGFTSSVKGEVYSNGGYRATFKAAKTFE